MRTDRRVIVVQAYVPDYRVGLFARLRAQLHEAGLPLVLAAGDGDSRRKDACPIADLVPLRDRLAWTGGHLRYRPLGALQLQASDLLVVEHAVKNLEVLPYLAGNGPAVAFWGHGFHNSSSRSGFPLLKRRLTMRADWYFAYTPQCAQSVIAAGFPDHRVTPLHNTLDTQELIDDMAALTDEDIAGYRARHDLHAGHTALFLGSVEESKDIRYLQKVLRSAHSRDPDFRLLVAGRGSLEGHLTATPGAVAVGRVVRREKALALAASEVLVIPQAVGLVAVDSLAGGTPLVTRRGRGHGPEADYLQHGVDSVWLPNTATPDEFADELVALLGDQERLERLVAGCLDKAPSLQLGRLADEFVSGIRRWAGDSRR